MMQRIILLVFLVLQSCDSSAPATSQRNLEDYSSSSSSSSSGLSFWGYILQLLHHCPPGQHYKSGHCVKPSHHHHSSSHSSGGGGGGGGGGSGYNYTDDTTYTYYSDKWGTDGWTDDGWGSDGYNAAYASTQTQSGNGTAVWPVAIGALVAAVIGAAFVLIRRKNHAEAGGSKSAFSFFSHKKQGALNENFDNDEPNFIEISDAKNKYKSPKNLSNHV